MASDHAQLDSDSGVRDMPPHPTVENSEGEFATLLSNAGNNKGINAVVGIDLCVSPSVRIKACP